MSLASKIRDAQKLDVYVWNHCCCSGSSITGLVKDCIGAEDPSHMLFTSALSETRLSTALLQLKENVEGKGAAKDHTGTSKLPITRNPLVNFFA